jgi:hypothetical protein
VARRAGLVRHRGPGSVPGSLDGSGDIAAKQGESGPLPFTGASITLPLVLVAAALLGGGLALRLGRSRYRPAHLRR